MDGDIEDDDCGGGGISSSSRSIAVILQHIPRNHEESTRMKNKNLNTVEEKKKKRKQKQKKKQHIIQSTKRIKFIHLRKAVHTNTCVLC